MNKEDLLDILSERLNNGIHILIALKDGPLLKEEIMERVNTYYKEKMKTNENLIASKHTLNIYAARLEGAGLVNVKELGRARMYSRSELADELTAYMKQKKLR
ncbi:hypothetical protein ACFFIX_20490 [Metabacillus herbersteinensis]|uniref:DNA-binding protein n=1 Tax=Metabacillus herbersteinensis TaxID=283816 RepID=A0ABV6GJB4_9BACI